MCTSLSVHGFMETRAGPSHHFVFVTLEADDAAAVAASVRTGLTAVVLQLQDVSIPRRAGRHLTQTQVIFAHLQTGRCTGRTLPGAWVKTSSRRFIGDFITLPRQWTQTRTASTHLPAAPGAGTRSGRTVCPCCPLESPPPSSRSPGSEMKGRRNDLDRHWGQWWQY